MCLFGRWFATCPLPLQTRWAADHHTVRLVPPSERTRRGGSPTRRLIDTSFAPQWETAALMTEHKSYGRRGLARSDQNLRRTLGYPKRLPRGEASS